MKTVLMTIVLASLILLSTGCNGNLKSKNTFRPKAYANITDSAPRNYYGGDYQARPDGRHRSGPGYGGDKYKDQWIRNGSGFGVGLPNNFGNSIASSLGNISVGK